MYGYDELEIGDEVEIVKAWGDIPEYGVIKSTRWIPHPIAGTTQQFGVQLEGATELTYYALWDLTKRKAGRKSIKCVCGSDKLGHPGHSDFCDKFVETREKK